MKKNLLLLLIAFQSAMVFAQNDADFDLLFNQYNNYGNTFYPHVLKSQNDGKILVGGSFTHFDGNIVNRFCRLNLNGSIESIFGTGFNNVVGCVDIQSDGKILCGGNFTTYNGTPAYSLVRLHTNGNIDSSFSPPMFTTSVLSLSVQPDGKIIAVGGSINRLNPDGSNDVSFDVGTGFYGGPGGYGLWSTALQSDGKILVGGSFSSFNGFSQNNLIRLNTDGSKDESFNIGSGFNNNGEFIGSIAIQTDGKILVGGDFTTYNGLSQNKLIRLNTDGTKDESFNIGSGFNGNVRGITIQNDGKILVTGSFNTFNGLTQVSLIRLNQNGTKDNTFNIGSGFNDGAKTILIQNDGKLLVGGTFTKYQGFDSYRFVRLKGNSTLSTTNFSKSKISIYPNPVSDILNFTLSETNTATAYEIYNLLGAKVSYGSLSSNAINVSNLAKGVYMVKIITENGVLTEKFIKE